MANSEEIIRLVGDDVFISHPVKPNRTCVYASENTAVSNNLSQSSSKIKTSSVVQYQWKYDYYVGNLLDVYEPRNLLAYSLKKADAETPVGIVRVLKPNSNSKCLLQDFRGEIFSLKFASHSSTPILAVIDFFSTIYLFEIIDSDAEMSYMHKFSIQPSSEPVKQSMLSLTCSSIKLLAGQGIDENLFWIWTQKNLVFTVNYQKCVERLNDSSVMAFDDAMHTLDKTALNVYPHQCGSVSTALLSPDQTLLLVTSIEGWVFLHKFLDNEIQESFAQMQPFHGGPVYSGFFLKVDLPADGDLQVYILCGSKFNRDFCISYYCECCSWDHVQQLELKPFDDGNAFPTTVNVKPHCFVGMSPDLTFFCVSDVKRTVIYLLELGWLNEICPLGIVSVNEFVLSYPCLSFVITSSVREKAAPSHNSSLNSSCGQEEDAIVPLGGEAANDVGPSQPYVVCDKMDVGFYSVHPRSLLSNKLSFSVPVSARARKPIDEAPVSHSDLVVDILKCPELNSLTVNGDAQASPIVSPHRNDEEPLSTLFKPADFALLPPAENNGNFDLPCSLQETSPQDAERVSSSSTDVEEPQLLLTPSQLNKESHTAARASSVGPPPVLASQPQFCSHNDLTHGAVTAVALSADNTPKKKKTKTAVQPAVPPVDSSVVTILLELQREIKGQTKAITSLMSKVVLQKGQLDAVSAVQKNLVDRVESIEKHVSTGAVLNGGGGSGSVESMLKVSTDIVHQLRVFQGDSSKKLLALENCSKLQAKSIQQILSRLGNKNDVPPLMGPNVYSVPGPQLTAELQQVNSNMAHLRDLVHQSAAKNNQDFIAVMQVNQQLPGRVADQVCRSIKDKAYTNQLGQMLNVALAEAYKNALTVQLVPAMNKGFQKLFADCNSTFQMGLKQFLKEVNDKISSLESKALPGPSVLAKPAVEEPVLKTIKSLQKVSQPTPVKAEVAVVASPKPNLSKPIAEVRAYMLKKQPIKALEVALNLAYQPFLLDVCQDISPESIFSPDKPRVSQSILLSLISQLSTNDLHDHLELKISYLREALLSLDKNDDVALRYGHQVLSNLHKRLNDFMSCDAILPSHSAGKLPKQILTRLATLNGMVRSHLN